jgi:hypothetical protein
MLLLGQGDHETSEGLLQMIRVTKDVNASMQLSTLASDLAASGLHTYAENIDLLQNIMLGRGLLALRQYGLYLGKNATIAEQLAAVQGQVTRTTEQMGASADGQIKIMQTSWDTFKQHLGTLTIWMEATFATKFNSIMQSLAGNSNNWAKSIALGFTLINKVMSTNLLSKEGITSLLPKNIIGTLSQTETEFNKMWDSVTGNTPVAKAAAKAAIDNLNLLTAAQMTAATAAEDKLKSAFTDFSKNVVSAFNDQQKAIDSLHSSLKDLDDTLNDDLVKSNEKYKADVVNMAKAAKDRMDTIDKQITDEKRSMNRGWRDKVAELEAEKAKEQSIIDRAGGQVIDLNTRVAKDDLTILEETHAQELADIQKQADEKKAVIDAEITARTDYLKKIQTTVMAPGLYGNVTTQGTSFLGSVGAAPMQQQLIFNFNGGVVGDAGIMELMQKVVDELNRMATLKGISGK